MALGSPIPSHVRESRWIDLAEGETITGRVVQLPARGKHSGTRLFLRVDDGAIVSIAATARRGWSLLERALSEAQVQPGDRVAIRYVGWRRTQDGARTYRNVSLSVLARAEREA